MKSRTMALTKNSFKASKLFNSLSKSGLLDLRQSWGRIGQQKGNFSTFSPSSLQHLQLQGCPIISASLALASFPLDLSQFTLLLVANQRVKGSDTECRWSQGG